MTINEEFFKSFSSLLQSRWSLKGKLKHLFLRIAGFGRGGAESYVYKK